MVTGSHWMSPIRYIVIIIKNIMIILDAEKASRMRVRMDFRIYS